MSIESIGGLSTQVNKLKKQQNVQFRANATNTLERNPKDDSFEKKGMSAGVKAGIAIGSLLGLAFAIKKGFDYNKLKNLKSVFGNVKKCKVLNSKDVLATIDDIYPKLNLKAGDVVEAKILSPRLAQECYSKSGKNIKDFPENAYSLIMCVNDEPKFSQLIIPKKLGDITDILNPLHDKVYVIPVK
jgi:ribosomal protein L14